MERLPSFTMICFVGIWRRMVGNGSVSNPSILLLHAAGRFSTLALSYRLISHHSDRFSVYCSINTPPPRCRLVVLITHSPHSLFLTSDHIILSIISYQYPSSPSCCSHQMVYFKDKVYLFGGEYATLDQVHPYLHLLLLLLKVLSPSSMYAMPCLPILPLVVDLLPSIHIL